MAKTKKFFGKFERDMCVVQWSDGRVEIIAELKFTNSKSAMGFVKEPWLILRIPKEKELDILIERPGSISISAKV